VLDPTARPEVDRALAELGPIIGQRFEHAAIVDAGGDPTATLAVAAARGYAFDDARTGAIVRDVAPKGNHGYPPSDPAMAASFVAVGPGIAHRDLGTIRMIDIAPTLAQQIDVPLPSAVGHAVLGTLSTSATYGSQPRETVDGKRDGFNLAMSEIRTSSCSR